MHPDTPIRVLDEIIRRYGVTCIQLVPFEGGGYCVKIGSNVEPVELGAGSLPEAIGKAFLELMRRQGRPSIDELIERSSLGTPRAKALRAKADPRAVKEILDRVHTYENPAVHWHRRPRREGDVHVGVTSACGLVRTGGTHAQFTAVLDEVTCGRCRATSWYKQAVRDRAKLS